MFVAERCIMILASLLLGFLATADAVVTKVVARVIMLVIRLSFWKWLLQ